MGFLIAAFACDHLVVELHTLIPVIFFKGARVVNLIMDFDVIPVWLRNSAFITALPVERGLWIGGPAVKHISCIA